MNNSNPAPCAASDTSAQPAPSITIDTIRNKARRFSMRITENTRHYKVFRIINGRAVFQGRRYIGDLKALNAYIDRLSNIVDYENSQIEC